MRVKLKKYKYHTIRTFSNSNSDTPYAHIDFHMGIHAIKRNEEKPSSISLQLVIIHTQSSGWVRIAHRFSFCVGCFCFVCLCPYPMSPVSADCPFWITLSVFL